MDRSGLTRGTRWYQNYFPSLNTWEVIHEQTFPPKRTFFHLVTSRTYSIRLTANPRAQIDNGYPGLSFGYPAILLASIVVEIVAIICENSPILRKFDLFWPTYDRKFDLIKNDLSIFCRNCRGLSNAVYRLSLSFLVFEISVGAVIRPPPPPAVRRWLRPPAVCGIWKLNYCSFVCYHGICSLISNYSVKWIEIRWYGFNGYKHVISSAKWCSFFRIKHAKNGGIWKLNYCSFVCYHGTCSLISNYSVKWIETRQWVCFQWIWKYYFGRKVTHVFLRGYDRKWFKLEEHFM